MSKSQIRDARGLDDQPGEDVDQGRLAGAIGAEQAEHRATRHRQIDAFERLLVRLAAAAAIDFTQAFDLDRQRRRAVAPCDLAQTVGIEHWQGEVAAILWHLVHDLFGARRQAAAVNDLVTARLLTKKR